MNISLIRLYSLFLVGIFCNGCATQNNDKYILNPHSSSNAHLFNVQWDSKVDLKGGISGSNLSKVSKNHQYYVIRDIQQRNDEDKIREVEAQLIASQEGYGPTVHAYDIPNGKILMSFLENVSNPLVLPDKAYHLAKLLLKIHRGEHYKLTAGNQITLRSSIWVLRNDQWQMIFHQGTVERTKT